MSKISLFIVGFGRPDLLSHQARLMRKFFKDDYELCVVDNTPGDLQFRMQQMCSEWDVGYMRVPGGTGEHIEALNHAAKVAEEIEAEFWGTLDHDVFPRAKTTLINKIEKAGFYGVGQRHAPTQRRYLWPGFAFWSRAWLDGRTPNYDGIRGEKKRDDGDTGSMLHELFQEDDWEKMFLGEHGYGYLRPEDKFGLQSWGFETFSGQWLHFSNSSHWMKIPNPDERDRLVMEMLQSL